MGDFLQTLSNEGRRAFRSLWRNPGSSFWTLVLLTGTIGAVTALGTAAYELLHGALPYGKASQLVMVWSDLPNSGYPRAPLSGPEIVDVRRRARSFSGVAAISGRTVTLGRPEDPLQIPVCVVTGNFFSVLEAPPLYGRTFTENDEGTGKNPTVILSWRLWQDHFGGDPAIIGRRVPINGKEAEVIGIMPQSFRMAFAADTNIPEKTQAWLPLEDVLPTSPRTRYFLKVIARLQDGVSSSSASSEVSSLASSLLHEYSDYSSSGRSMYVVSLTEDLAKPVKPAAYSLLFAGVFLVLLGFVNLSGLLIARTVEQRKEHAICQAIGASIQRVRNQMLLQVCILATVGCVLGLIAGRLGLMVLRQVRPPSLARMDHAGFSWPMLLLVLGIVVLSSLFLAAAIRATITPLRVSDISGSRVQSGTHYRLRAGLIIAQVAFALLFLVGSALCMRTFLNVLRTDLGFRPENALTVKYSLNPLKFNDVAEFQLTSKRVDEAAKAISGVQAAGTITFLPLDGLPPVSLGYRSEQADENSKREADARNVSPGFLNAVGARLLAGRFFEESDDPKSPKVVVVDRSLAERTWPGQSAVGKKLIVDTWPGTPPTPFIVAGVIEHMRYKAIEMEVREQIYLAQRQYPWGPWALVVRSNLDPVALAATLRTRIHEVDPRIPVWDARLLSDYYSDAASDRRFTAVLLSIFAIAAVLLAAIGVYGLLAYIVAARRNEFGIRIALGARSHDVIASVLQESLMWAFIGSAITLVVFLPLVSRISHSLLYGVTAYDPVSWVLAAVVLIVVVAIASWVPAFRAGRTDPAALMRSQ